MQIVFAASEAVPFAKTGGLADVVGALPRQILKLGHEVTVYLPLYATVRSQLGGERKVPYPFHYDSFSAQQSLRGNRGWRGARWSEVLLCRLPGNV